MLDGAGVTEVEPQKAEAFAAAEVHDPTLLLVRAMSETRKIAAILVADVVGYSRLAGADEDRTLARLRALRSDLIDPTIAVHHRRVVKRTGESAPGTAFLSSFAAWSTRCVARLKCKMAWSGSSWNLPEIVR